MDIYVIDFETYFDETYNLKRVTTEAYVRGPEFKAHCVGVFQPAAGGNPYDRFHDVALDQLVSYRDWSETAILCHHAHFDGLILAHHFGIRPAFWLDTLSMGRALFPRESVSLASLAGRFGLAEKTVPYDKVKGRRDLPPDLMAELAAGAAHDCRLTWQVFQQLGKWFPREEYRVVDMTIRLFTEPVLQLDVARATAFLEAERSRKMSLLSKVDMIATQVRKDDVLVGALERLGVDVPMKWSKAKECMVPAFAKTDAGMTDLLEHPLEAVQALAMARLETKSTIGETRAERLLSMASRGALCVYLNYAGAHTWRWSGGDKTNFQNLQRGSELRMSLLPPPEGDWVLVIGDQSQIECRMLNYVAGQWSVLEAFQQGRDIYCENATKFYGREITKADKEPRQLGKKMELSCGFGAGGKRKPDGRPGRFREMCRVDGLHISDDESELAVNIYRSSHEKVVQLWNFCSGTLMPWLSRGSEAPITYGLPTIGVELRLDNGRLVGPNGTYLDFTGLRQVGRDWVLPTKRGWTFLTGPKLTENVIQWLARISITQALLRITDLAPWAKFAMQTHDEVVFVCRRSQAEEVAAIVEQELSRSPQWAPGIPLAAEVHVSERYDK